MIIRIHARVHNVKGYGHQPLLINERNDIIVGFYARKTCITILQDHLENIII